MASDFGTLIVNWLPVNSLKFTRAINAVLFSNSLQALHQNIFRYSAYFYTRTKEV
jgi:hypothetical protein